MIQAAAALLMITIVITTVITIMTTTLATPRTLPAPLPSPLLSHCPLSTTTTRSLAQCPAKALGHLTAALPLPPPPIAAHRLGHPPMSPAAALPRHLLRTASPVAIITTGSLAMVLATASSTTATILALVGRSWFPSRLPPWSRLQLLSPDSVVACSPSPPATQSASALLSALASLPVLLLAIRPTTDATSLLLLFATRFSTPSLSVSLASRSALLSRPPSQ